MKKAVNVGLIGVGMRATHLGKTLCGLDKRVKVKAIFDPDKGLCRKFNEEMKQDALICDDYKEMLGDPSIEWVMVVSPNCYHREQVVESFKAGKHVFSEKPLATSIKDCQSYTTRTRMRKGSFSQLALCCATPRCTEN